MTLTTTAEPLVETDWLAAHLNVADLRVIEIDVNPTAYNQGHIEGAVFWNVYTDLLQPSYRVLERERFAELLSRSGIRPDTTVVVYGYAASRGFWLLAHYGHRRMSLLNGSRRKWIAEQRPLSGELSSVPPAHYGVTDFQEIRQGIRASHQQVEQAIGDPQRRLMDVRSMLEYSGERFWPSLAPEGNQRGGHVPGAILVPIEDTWQEDGSFRSVAELRQFYASHGCSPDQEIITYCAVGGRASQAWFVLTYLLGYPKVRVYDGSWIEWGTLPGVPVERVLL